MNKFNQIILLLFNIKDKGHYHDNKRDNQGIGISCPNRPAGGL
jgi:hypothetical protein